MRLFFKLLRVLYQRKIYLTQRGLVLKMGQNADSGRAGNNYGYMMGSKVAQFLGAELLGKNSNEATLNGEIIVIKSARRKTSSIGVTPKMLERIKWIIVALENMDNSYTLYRIKFDWYKSKMYPSRSKNARGTMMVSCKDIISEGKKLESNIIFS